MRKNGTSLRRARGRSSAPKDLPAQARPERMRRMMQVPKKETDTQMTPAQRVKKKKSQTRKRLSMSQRRSSSAWQRN